MTSLQLLLLLCATAVASMSRPGDELDRVVHRVGSTIKIGKYDRGGPSSTGRSSGRSGSSIRLGEHGAKLFNTTRPTRPALTTAMTSTDIPLAYSTVGALPESSNATGFQNNTTKLLKVC